MIYNYPMKTIQVHNLSKYYRVYKKNPGFMGSLQSLFHREHYEAKAVDDISFEIEEGELIGFIGPNGAGKTTTLKCLSGLLWPTKGNISVLGYTPFDRKRDFLSRISLVMGQKNQLWWDLPAYETFLLNKEIYQIEKNKFKSMVEELSSLLQVEDILHVQVRKLSLGQRMKCELIAALLHSPKVLFLDEPTIGLDIVMQKNIRKFIKEYNVRSNATIILTSHYMDDVEALCKRIIIIDFGKIIFDGNLENIIRKYAKNKLLTVMFNKPVERKTLQRFGEIKEYQPLRVELAIPVLQAHNAASELLKNYPVEDLNIEDPDIETIIRYIFLTKKV